MLKYAYERGYAYAIKEAGLTPAQMQATQLAGGVGGGALGALGGGLLGKHLGEGIGESMEMEDKDRALAKLISTGALGLIGGAGGAVLGSQIPRALMQTEAPTHAGEEARPELGEFGRNIGIPMNASPYGGGGYGESALGVLPGAYDEYGYGY